MTRDLWYQEEIDRLIKFVSELKSEEEIEMLFDKILTPREINDIARRFEAMEMLKKGKSYTDIREKLNLSPVIISRLSNKVGYGFRRSSSIETKKSKKKDKLKKKVIKYKGATPVHRMLD